MDERLKPLEWVGRSREELDSFPRQAMRRAGFNLAQVQRGLPPEDWKPMSGVGPGAAEIRVRTFEGGTVQHRVVYVAKFEEAVYVLHAFEKKTPSTSPHNREVARARYAQMLRERNSSGESRP